MKKKFKQVFWMLLVVIALTGCLDIMHVQASTKEGAKTGTIAGVTYSEEEMPLIGKEDEIQGIWTTLTNNNKDRVAVAVEYTFYDENGEKIADDSFQYESRLKNAISLKPNSSEKLYFSLVRKGKEATDPDFFVHYSDYKITYYVMKESQTVNKKKKGAKSGVEYKASSIDIDTKLFSEKETQNIYSTDVLFAFHNTNKYPVYITGKCTCYEKNGKKSSGKASGKALGSYDIELWLYPNEKLIDKASLKNRISDYKMTYTVEKISEENLSGHVMYSKFQLKKNIKMGKKYRSRDKVFHVESCKISGDEFTFNLEFDKEITYPSVVAVPGYSIDVNCYDKQSYPLGKWFCITGYGDSLQKGDKRQVKVIAEGINRKEVGSFDIVLYDTRVVNL